MQICINNIPEKEKPRFEIFLRGEIVVLRPDGSSASEKEYDIAEKALQRSLRRICEKADDGMYALFFSDINVLISFMTDMTFELEMEYFCLELIHIGDVEFIGKHQFEAMMEDRRRHGL